MILLLLRKKLVNTLSPINKLLRQKIEPREKLMKKKLFVKGQVHGTYIICEDETGMYIVDQHAGQERINYEYFWKNIKILIYQCGIY